MKSLTTTRYLYIVMIILAIFGCSKETEVPVEQPQLPNPMAAFSIKQVDTEDPFTFEFVNEAKDFNEVRWSFGDDSTSAQTSPQHTFLKTGSFTVKQLVLNQNGDWAQREEVIKIEAEKLVEFEATPKGSGALTLSYKSGMKIENVYWIKGKIDGTKISTDASTGINIPVGTFADYTLYAFTPKGSRVVIAKLLTDLGVVKDWTNVDNTFSILQDNGSGPDGNEGSKKLIDGDINSKIFVGGVQIPYWWQFVFYQPQIINAYTITSGNDADTRDPKSWEIQGSQDGEHWETLDVRSNQIFATRKLSVTYTFTNPKKFAYYRFYMTATNGSSNFQLSEFRMLEMPQ